MRGTEDIVEEITTQLENIDYMINTQIPLSKQSTEKKQRIQRMPQYLGADTIFERLNILN